VAALLIKAFPPNKVPDYNIEKWYARIQSRDLRVKKILPESLPLRGKIPLRGIGLAGDLSETGQSTGD
jgi:hypothetical protein